MAMNADAADADPDHILTEHEQLMRTLEGLRQSGSPCAEMVLNENSTEWQDGDPAQLALFHKYRDSLNRVPYLQRDLKRAEGDAVQKRLLAFSALSFCYEFWHDLSGLLTCPVLRGFELIHCERVKTQSVKVKLVAAMLVYAHLFLRTGIKLGKLQTDKPVSSSTVDKHLGISRDFQVKLAMAMSVCMHEWKVGVVPMPLKLKTFTELAAWGKMITRKIKLYVISIF